MIRAPVPRVQVVESVSRGRLAWLFDRDGLREVPRLIDIRALEIGHVVGEELQRKYVALTKKLEGQDVERPLHWGGYTLRAKAVELWVADPVRLHECIRYERTGAGGAWAGSRRAP